MFYPYIVYMLFMNALTFILYRADKKRAVARQWRIPESVLLGLSLLGGCVGAFTAMRVFRHKTRHARFAMGVPILILFHGCLAVYLFERGFLSFPW